MVVHGNTIDNSHKAQTDEWCSLPCNKTIFSHVNKYKERTHSNHKIDESGIPYVKKKRKTPKISTIRLYSHGMSGIGKSV